MCPISRRLVNGDGGLSEPGRMVCHCLLIETDRGLVLVDTGYGLADVEDPRRLGPLLPLLRAQLDPGETAVRRVEALGFTRDDVRHIVVTHLDLDHAGGLGELPRARVHVMRREHDAAIRRRLADRLRYRPAHWAHGPDWAVHDVSDGEPWLGFEAVRQLDGLPPEILLVPLYGHTRGHAGVAVQTAEGWLLHAGDAYFYRGQMDSRRPHCPSGLALFERSVQTDAFMRAWNQRRLRALVREHGHRVRVFCAHDPLELDELGPTSGVSSGPTIDPPSAR